MEKAEESTKGHRCSKDSWSRRCVKRALRCRLNEACRSEVAEQVDVAYDVREWREAHEKELYIYTLLGKTWERDRG